MLSPFQNLQNFSFQNFQTFNFLYVLVLVYCLTSRANDLRTSARRLHAYKFFFPKFFFQIFFPKFEKKKFNSMTKKKVGGIRNCLELEL